MKVFGNYSRFQLPWGLVQAYTEVVQFVQLVWESFMGQPETYLKTQQLADALGLSISSVKRLVDAGTIPAIKTSGKHRRVTLSNALQFAREEKYPTEGLLALSGVAAGPAINDRLVEEVLEALKAGRSREVSALILAAYAHEADAVALADALFRPVLERIGQLWLVGAWDIYEEHQATMILSGVIAELIRLEDARLVPGAPLALGAAPEGDIYTIPGLLGELVLKSRGWEVRNLGNHLPMKSLASAVREYRPRLVFLSASHIADRVKFEHDYSCFYEAALQHGVAIMLGGQALDPDLRSRLLYASFGDRMSHLAEFARMIQPLPGATSGADPSRTEPTDLSS